MPTRARALRCARTRLRREPDARSSAPLVVRVRAGSAHNGAKCARPGTHPHPPPRALARTALRCSGRCRRNLRGLPVLCRCGRHHPTPMSNVGVPAGTLHSAVPMENLCVMVACRSSVHRTGGGRRATWRSAPDGWPLGFPVHLVERDDDACCGAHSDPARLWVSATAERPPPGHLTTARSGTHAAPA